MSLRSYYSVRNDIFYFVTMKIKVLVIFIITSVSLFARDKDNLFPFYKGNSSLPSFIYNRGNEAYGVSDPGMDTLKAQQMAIVRAAFVHAINKGVSLKMITDYYTKNEQLTNSYDENREKCMSLANLSIDSVTYHYNIIHQYTSDRGETFVCLQFADNATDSITLSANCDFMSSNDLDREEQSEYKIIITIKSQIGELKIPMDYTMKGYFDNPLIESVYDGQKECYCRNAFWYYNEGNVEKEIKTYSLINGVWCAMVQSLCDNIVCMVFRDAQVKNVDETYNNSIQSLSRELYNSRVSYSPILLGIENNRISFKWNVHEM